MTVSDSVDIPGVTPAEAYAQVSDPTQMGRWSPEATGAVVEQGSGSLRVGDVFVGSNSRFGRSWHTRCRVTAAEPGERFAFEVVAWGVKIPRLKVRVAEWEYRFAAVDGGTRVTETWRDLRGWPAPVARRFDALVTGGKTFAEHHRKNIARTLAALQADLQRG